MAHRPPATPTPSMLLQAVEEDVWALLDVPIERQGIILNRADEVRLQKNVLLRWYQQVTEARQLHEAMQGRRLMFRDITLIGCALGGVFIGMVVCYWGGH
jgi:hypothetical protein